MSCRPVIVAILILSCLARGAEIRHRFLCIDNTSGKNQLIHINQHDPEANWTAPLPGSPARDIQLIGNGRVLVSIASGCREYDLETGGKLWEVTGFSNINTARRLQDGSTLLGANSRNGITLYTVDHSGNELSRRILHPETSALRLLRLTPEGNFLLSLGQPYRAVEMTPAGAIVWQVDLTPLHGKGYKVLKTPEGHYLASIGDGVKVVEFAADGSVVRYWGEAGKSEHPDWRLDFFSGFDVLPNGNVVAANWLGHGKQGTGPHVVEFDAGNNLVWQWEDHQLAGQITNVLILDGRDDEIAHGSAP